MFKLKPKWHDPEPAQSGDAPTTPQPPVAAPVDVQAQIDAALARQQAEFNAQLKKVTGHDDLKAYAEAQLKAQGKLQELIDARTAEAQSYKAKYEQMAVDHALLAAASEAIDPTLVTQLLAARAKVDESGQVSIDGQPAATAVSQLLKDKPFLAKAQGGTGSGAPQTTSTPAANPWRHDSWNLTEQVRLTTENPSLAAQLKAAASL